MINVIYRASRTQNTKKRDFRANRTSLRLHLPRQQLARRAIFFIHTKRRSKKKLAGEIKAFLFLSHSF